MVKKKTKTHACQSNSILVIFFLPTKDTLESKLGFDLSFFF